MNNGSTKKLAKKSLSIHETTDLEAKLSLGYTRFPKDLRVVTVQDFWTRL